MYLLVHWDDLYCYLDHVCAKSCNGGQELKLEGTQKLLYKNVLWDDPSHTDAL